MPAIIFPKIKLKNSFSIEKNKIPRSKLNKGYEGLIS